MNANSLGQGDVPDLYQVPNEKIVERVTMLRSQEEWTVGKVQHAVRQEPEAGANAENVQDGEPNNAGESEIRKAASPGFL